MNEESGIEIGKHIHRKNRSTKIIFQTNFGNYCKEAMNRTHAFAFLEKPLKAPAVEEQIKEFFEDSEGMQDLLMDFHNVRYSLDGKDVVKSILSIPVKEIVYFEYIKMQKEIKIVTKSTEYIYTEAMNKLEEKCGLWALKCVAVEYWLIWRELCGLKCMTFYWILVEMFRCRKGELKKFRERINEYLHDSFH